MSTRMEETMTRAARRAVWEEWLAAQSENDAQGEVNRARLMRWRQRLGETEAAPALVTGAVVGTERSGELEAGDLGRCGPD